MVNLSEPSGLQDLLRIEGKLAPMVIAQKKLLVILIKLAFESLSSVADEEADSHQQTTQSKSKANGHKVDLAGHDMRSIKWSSQQMRPCSQLQLVFLFPACSTKSLTDVRRPNHGKTQECGSRFLAGEAANVCGPLTHTDSER